MVSIQASQPARVLLFGATGHISGPAADTIAGQAPNVALRLATSRRDQISVLQQRYPAAEVVQADYLDVQSLIAATDGVDAMFIITPDFLDEQRAMTNLVAAVNRGHPTHLLRLTADPPHVHRREQVSPELSMWRNGVALNHLTARGVLEGSELPVTFLNIAAYYMDTISRTMAGPIVQARTLVVPFERRMNFIDPRDVGTVAAKLLLSQPSVHVGKTYHLDNGVDCLTFTELAALMTEIFGATITYDDDPDTFLRLCGPMVDSAFGAGTADYILAYMRWEQTASTIWRRTDIFSTLFDLEPRTLREWLIENRTTFGF